GLLARTLGLAQALVEDAEGRLDLALAAFLEDLLEHLPDVGEALVVVAPVAQDVGDADQAPACQFAQAGADVGAGHVEGEGDVFGVHGAGREIEQGVDLRDGAVDPPGGAELTPVEDELLHGGGEREHACSRISVSTEYTEHTK